MAEPLSLRFGELEAILADLNGIPSHNRTAFQARLKNFHRLGFPEGIGQGRGKAVIYGAEELVLMALAVELTQLGLTPERVIEVMEDDFDAVWQSVALAAHSLRARPEVFSPDKEDAGKVRGFIPWADDDTENYDPFSIFLYCDPATLAPWNEDGQDRSSNTFFYGGSAIVRENLTRWTTGPTRRLALINVTKLLFDIAAHRNGERGLEVVEQFETAADECLHRGDFDLDAWLQTDVKPLAWTVWSNPKRAIREGVVAVASLRDIADLSRPYVVVPDQDEQQSKPDMLLLLPGQRELIVDSKVSSDISEKPEVAVRRRIEQLAAHPYRTPFSDRTDYQLMFVPYDQLLSDALAADKSLWELAMSNNILMVTPASFPPIVKTVEKIWSVRRKTPDGQEEFDLLSERKSPMVRYGNYQEA